MSRRFLLWRGARRSAGHSENTFAHVGHVHKVLGTVSDAAARITWK